MMSAGHEKSVWSRQCKDSEGDKTCECDEPMKAGRERGHTST
jgi:hypothetical protein